MVKNQPSNAGDDSSILDQGTKIPRTLRQLSSSATTREARKPQWRPSAAKKKKKKDLALKIA